MLDRGRMLFAYGVFYPEGGDIDLRGQAHRLRRPHGARLRLRAPGLVGPAGPRDRATSTCDAQFGPTATSTTASTARRSRSRATSSPRHAAGDGHDLAPGLRLRDRLPADRRGPLPRGGREGHRVPARPHALRSTRTRASSTGTTASTSPAARRRRSSPPSSATTTTRSRPTSRSTRSPARSQTYRVTGDPRILSDIEMTIELFDRFYLDREQRRLLLAHRPDHVRPAQPRRSAHNRARKNWNSRRRPRARLPDQPVPRDRRRAVRRLPRLHGRHDRQALPGLRQQPVRAGALLRGLEPRPRRGAGSRTAPSSATT